MIFDLTDNVQLTLPSYFELALIVFAFVILNFTLFLSYKRLGNSIRFAVVTIINVVSFCTLIGLISDVNVKGKVESTQTLLTYGASQQQIDSLLADNNKMIFSLSSMSLWQDSLDLSRIQDKLVVIDDVAEILVYQPNIEQLRVYGDGLLPQQWQSLQAFDVQTLDNNNLAINNRINVEFFPSESRTGPINLHWPKQLIIGQPLTIQGIFKTAAKDTNRIYRIILSDLYGETIDELRVKNNEGFNLSALIQNQGLFIYKFKVFDDNKQLLLAEPVAFSVSSAEPIKVAIKQSSASFESKHFKHWLAEQGEEVLVITQVSKGKYTQQGINLASNNSSDPNKEMMLEKANKELNISWLKNFNLLYMDGRAFLNLSKKEIAQLDKSIAQGLGLLIMVDDEMVASSNQVISNSLMNKIFKNDSLLTTITTASELPLSTVARWLNSQGEQVISYKKVKLFTAHGDAFIKGSEGQTLWINRSYGFGSIAFSLVDSSYQWATSGEKTHYSQYWQYIIEQVGRQQKNATWQNEPKDSIIFQGQIQNICAQLNKKDIGQINAQEIDLLPSFVTESKYCGAYWANTRGWQTFNLVDVGIAENQKSAMTSSKSNSPSKQLSSFVYAEQDWSTWQQHLKQTASFLVAENSRNSLLGPIYIQQNKKNLWWLFFISLSLLWLERKAFQ